jgi:hypothetical protein
VSTDQAIREAKNRWARRRRRLIGYGQWQPFTDAAPVREHVLAIKATGMGLAGIAKHTNVKRGTLEHLLYGKDHYPPAVKIRTESAQALLAYWPALDDYEDHTTIDGTGTRRRMQALAAAGWTAHAVHQRVGGAHKQTFERLHTCRKVTARLACAVRDFYNEYSSTKPEDHGVEPWIAERTRSTAAKRDWAPAIAWDDDTIEDPAAHPDWTGFCGTDSGWWMHTNNGIPACPRCEAAHRDWLAERKHLPAVERFRQLGYAKGAASNRGAVLAADARELMRISGLDTEQVAQRLGVTRNHIQQELLRHPEQTDMETAA